MVPSTAMAQVQSSKKGSSMPENEPPRGNQHWVLFQRLDEVSEDIDDPGRWPMLRDLLVFQGKLALDALRDLALSPISLFAGLLGIIRNTEEPGRYFYSLMNLGKRSDQWINLFGAAATAGIEFAPENEPSVDGLVSHLETLLVKQYEQGGVTAQAKEAIDKVLKSVHQTANEVAQKGP